MHIADITAQDTGGQSFKLSRAINEYTNHTSRSFCGTPDYLNFPSDITHDTDQDLITTYLANADIIHCHNMYRYANGWAPINPNAKWIIHQHGRPGANVVWKEWEEADKERGATRFVSTINLLKYVNDNPDRWIPAPIRLKEFDDLKRLWKPSDKVRICQTPTNPEYKKTDLLKKVCDELVKEGLPLELRIISGKSHKEAMIEKAQCDITFDQIHLQYGNSGLEGMALGQAVIVGCPEETDKRIQEIIGYRPYVYATEENLKEVIRKLVEDEDYRNEMGKLGRKYVEDWHDDKKVAEKMIGIYERL